MGDSWLVKVSAPNREAGQDQFSSGSACVPRAGDGVPPSRTFLKPLSCPEVHDLREVRRGGTPRQHARRMRYPGEIERRVSAR
jgi:hypothetical protein